MDKFESGIGKNIRDIRLERGLSQEALAELCGFSNTTLSAYENSRKIPNLTTIARIAKQLNVAIERLYYGDENNAFIIAAPDEGKKIVNSIYYLWSMDVISYYENFITGGTSMYPYGEGEMSYGIYVHIQKYHEQVKRLIISLNEFRKKKETYSDPEKYLELILSSVATEINNEIELKKRESEEKQKRLQSNLKRPKA